MGSIFSRAMSHVHPIRSLKNVSRKAVTKQWQPGFEVSSKKVGKIGQEQLTTVNDVFEGPTRLPRQLRDQNTEAFLFDADGTTPLMDTPPRRLDRLNADDFNVGVRLDTASLRHGKGSAHFRYTVADEHGRAIKVKKDPSISFLADSIPETAKDTNGKRAKWIRAREKSQPDPVHTQTEVERKTRAIYNEANALDQAIDEAKTHAGLPRVNAEDHTSVLSLKFLKKYGSGAYREALQAFIRNSHILGDLDSTVRLKSNGVFRISTELPGKEYKVPFKKNPLTKRKFKEFDLKKRSDETWDRFIDRAVRQAQQQERTLNNRRRNVEVTE